MLRARTRIARRPRRDATEVEKRLWLALCGIETTRRSRRQHPIGPYVVDFANPGCKLAIELDGSQHIVNEASDALRTEELARRGYRVLRFWNSDVIENMDGVLETIRLELERDS
jgi:very-short-patch-repair endonuclease